MRILCHRVLARLDGWPRRLAAGLCLLIAAVSALRPGTRRAGEATDTVLVAAHDLAVGARLAAGDLRAAQWPPALIPSGRLTTTDEAVGRRLGSPLARGEPVTRTRLVGHELTAGLEADHVASTVIVTGGVDALAHPGDRVDLIVAPDGDPLGAHDGGEPPTAAVIAHDAEVLAVLTEDNSQDPSASTLIVSTTRSAALLLAGVSGSRILAVMGRSP